MSGLPDYVKISPRGTYWASIACHRWADETIEIGSYTSVAQGVSLLAGGLHNHSNVSTYPFDVLMRGAKTGSPEDRCYRHGKGISIGSDVHLGVSCSIIGHVTIGHGAVIAANATVFTDVPPYGIAVGNPARVNKFRFDEATVAALLRIAWWEWPEEMIRANVDNFYLPIAQFVERFKDFTNHAPSCLCGTCRDASGKQWPVACSGVLSCV